MLENIAIEIAEELNNAGINAVTAFNASELEDVSAFVCVGLKSARISSSGLGNYIGVCTEDGQLKEMYGEKAELVLSFDVYSPASADEGCSELADGVRCVLFNIDGKISVGIPRVRQSWKSQLFRVGLYRFVVEALVTSHFFSPVRK